MMKTGTIKRMAATCCVVVALAFIAGCTTGNSSGTSYQAPGTARGGAVGLMQGTPIRTGEDVAALKPGDQVVMSCPKCKNVYLTRVEKENKQGQTREVAGVEHLCPGCDHKRTMVGHGRSAKEVITHVCRNCGSEDAFCCVIKAGQGPTQGMPGK